MADQKMQQFILIDSKEIEAKLTIQHLQPALEEHRAQLVVFHDGAEALDYILSTDEVSLVITAFRLVGIGGLKLVEEVKAARPHLPSIVVSGTADATIAIRAVQAGAYDFLSKPTDSHELADVISEAIQGASLRVNLDGSGDVDEPEAPRLIGNSRAMLKVYRDLAKLAPTPVTVLIRGETGTGKELIAQALHEHGHRAHKPFIAVNCAAIPENLLESELFGHEKGAFTGAVGTKIGRFEQANGATLFLDEIGDMQPFLQAKMLRVLQERVIQRVGGRSEIPVDVRVIAATHRNLEKMVEEGGFREDLLYRLNGSTIKLPALRDRLGDVKLLTDHFLTRFGKDLSVAHPQITAEALSFLSRQTWPGNIRQLQNVLRQVILKRRELTITDSDLESLIDAKTGNLGDDLSMSEIAESVIAKAQNDELAEGAYREMLHLMEASLISHTLRVTDGNLSKSAQLLGITRYTLREKMKGLE